MRERRYFLKTASTVTGSCAAPRGRGWPAWTGAPRRVARPAGCQGVRFAGGQSVRRDRHVDGRPPLESVDGGDQDEYHDQHEGQDDAPLGSAMPGDAHRSSSHSAGAASGLAAATTAASERALLREVGPHRSVGPRGAPAAMGSLNGARRPRTARPRGASSWTSASPWRRRDPPPREPRSHCRHRWPPPALSPSSRIARTRRISSYKSRSSVG